MGVKRNFAYNSVLTVSQYIFPLLIFPYISRVLKVENIGLINFVDSIVYYFILIASMGVIILGTREIAKAQYDQDLRNEVYSSLLWIHAVLTIIALAFYFLLVFIVPKFTQYKELYFIGSAKILFTCLLIEWFYKGIEKFSYIVKRTIILKSLYTLSIFIFVRGVEDYYIYFGLTAGLVVVNALYNFIYSRKFATFSFDLIKIRKYIKPFFALGFYILLSSMYTTFNVIYLGFVSDNVQVGYYTTAVKIYTIILALFSAFSGVMMPRMSALIAQQDEFNFKRLIDKSFSFVFTISFPVIFCIIILSPSLIPIIVGRGYEGAVMPLQFIMPLILIVGVAQIFAIQILIPLGRDKEILKVSIWGALIGIIFNILLVKRFESIGSAAVLVFSEIIVTAFLYYYVYKCLRIKIPYKLFFSNLLCAIPYILICYASFKAVPDHNILSLTIALVISALYFVCSQLFFLKGEIAVDIKNILLKIRNHSK